MVEKIEKNVLTAWERVEIARSPKRKTALDYINEIFDEFIELHGDRCYGDDKAMVCGLGRIENQNYTIIAEQKGRNTKENIERNFGMPNPESYRKAIRIMKQAEKFNRPVITFIDTKGAYPGVEAEQRGQGDCNCNWRRLVRRSFGNRGCKQGNNVGKCYIFNIVSRRI